ncbi:DUF5908 family protein [Pedobacter sp. PACM 27299]|uniref:DUF5908 family protein n=1 Tax=Pedobacter sp. PACM 27299 TaxID=1727164 RepID=UPI0012FC000C|nr:DUF5908 family protein [Pedobacter sp. PACM 27299]
MAIEIRELIIKTEISVGDRNYLSGIKEEDLRQLKKQIMEECRKIIAERTKKTSYKR